LKEWALREGVHPVTAYQWFLEGKLPVPASRAGHLIGWRWWRMRPELMTAWCQT